ncbi:MAG: hypothetical protein F4X66_12405 [Chloroflexi bacterium]|nr:hypothetical protein [Chloroflexota bacterium]MYE38659.1 hypothetical protein [Chloroflexota bacterium]
MSEADVKQAIQKVVKTIDEYDEFLTNSHEYQTRYALIDPVLRSLGWDLSSVEEVEVEYETEWGRVDYALLKSSDGPPSVIVEAKSLWKPLDSATVQRQILSYAEGTKQGYAILTNGDVWMIYDLKKRGRFQNKLIVEIELTEEPVASSAKTLNQLLRRNLHWKK